MTTTSKPLEGDIQKECLDYLNTLDNCWFVNIVGGATQEGGIPDILICYKNTFYGVELKRGSSYKETGRQKIHLRRITRAGGIGVKIESLQELKDLLKSPS